MLTESMPSRSASSTAACSTRVRFNGIRRSSFSRSTALIEKPLDILTSYGLPYAIWTSPYDVWTERTTPGERDDRPTRRSDRAQPRSPRSATLTVHAAALVRPDCLGRPSRALSWHRRSTWSVAAEARQVGDDAPRHGRPPNGQGARSDRRLLRGRSEHRDDGDERLGRGRTGVVAQPSWAPRRRDRAEGESRTRAVRGRAAEGDERDRLWDIWRGYTPHLDGYATMRSTDTAIVVLEPRPA